MEEVDRCKGCVLGAWLGDATGAVLEFQGRPSASALNAALTLPGGGIVKVGPGQVTDDGELTCCLLLALVESNSQLNLNKIAAKYGKWIQSKPFDLGGTLRKSLPKACNMKVHQAEMVRRGAKLSNTSQSNGCLMRISPLAVWCRNLSLEDTMTAVREEVKLTHTNETVQFACCFYVIAIGFLLKTGIREAAYMRTKEFLTGKTNSEFLEWLELVEASYCELPVHKPCGWSKIAFVYGFRYLLAGVNYHDAIFEIMRQGGDTDTNACIIGALIAAADGLNSLDQAKVEKVINWDISKGGIRRPDWLTVKHCAPVLDRLIENSPSVLEMIGSSLEYIKP